MSFLDEVTEAVKPIVGGQPVLLAKPHGRTDLSFRSTLYNALRSLGVDAQIKKVSPNEFKVIPKTASNFSSEKVKKLDTITTSSLNLEIGLGAAMMVKHGIVLSFEFIGYTLAEFHELTQEQLKGDIAAGVELEETALSVKMQRPLAVVETLPESKPTIDDLVFEPRANAEKE